MLLEKLLPPPDEEVEKYMKEKCKDELERLDHNVMLLQNWINCQSYMPKNIDPSILKCQLIGCKFRLENAKQKLQLLLYCRQTMPDLFKLPIFTPEEEESINTCVCTAMPKLTNKGFRVSYYKNTSPKVELFDLSIYVKMFWNFMTLKVTRDHLQLGEIWVFDGANITIPHISLTLDPRIKKSITVQVLAVALRIEAVYIINAPPFANKILNLFSPLISTKLKNKIIIDCGTDLLKNLPPECVPKDYGGSAMYLDEYRKLWRACVEEEIGYFELLSELKLTGDIPKNLKDSCFKDDMIGVQGSFRQLIID